MAFSAGMLDAIIDRLSGPFAFRVAMLDVSVRTTGCNTASMPCWTEQAAEAGMHNVNPAQVQKTDYEQWQILRATIKRDTR